MQKKWIKARFFISTGGASPTQKDGLLPPHLVTVSDCISEIYPNYWALAWASATKEEIATVRKTLRLDEAGMAKLQQWISNTWESGLFGWPNVFLSQEAAQEFKNLFLPESLNVRLLGISLEEHLAAEFVENEAPEQGFGASGVWEMLSKMKPLTPTSQLLGFEILGMEYGSSFHTAACNGLEVDYHREFGITFNQFGLIDHYTKAVQACNYTNLDKVGAEPVPWYPFRVDQYLFDELST